jgi:Ca2+-transporting ATPase
VLGVAKAKHDAAQRWPDIQHTFEFELVGLVGFADPLRPEVPAAVAECRRAGIRVVMITGDHPRTARAIAAAAGIGEGELLTGAEIASLDTTALTERIGTACIFARVTPQQKLAVVEALKDQGEVVAMTGDGVNDAPALKAAHIGIAMGKRGTDVAREAASLVLLEDDFAAIVSAIRLGRRIFANLRQALVYTLAVHVPIIGLSILPVLFGMPLILAPIHIAFLELVIDPACSVVFEAETGEEKLMLRPPRSPAEPLLAGRHLALSLVQGVLGTLVVVGLYAWLLGVETKLEESRALAFVALMAANVALILSCRAARPGWRSLFADVSPVGRWVIGGTLLGVSAITLVPALAEAFAFRPPSIPAWSAAFFAGAGTLALFELGKAALRKLH